jgi:hypothetical protein
MSKPLILGDTVWELPPLILHPFNERVSPNSLLENSRAALMLSGLIPSEGSDQDELHRRILAGRFGEIRMLFFLGKDVFRWIDQCVEWAASEPGLASAGLGRQSFAGFLASNPPESVKAKLAAWGVADPAAIFSRAIALNAIFAQAPDPGQLSDEFLRSYHRYASSLFRSYMNAKPYGAIGPANFRFTVYASGEYTKILESQWSKD